MDSQSARGTDWRAILRASDARARRSCVPIVVVMSELADRAAERDRAMHRAAFGIEHDGRAANVVLGGKGFELARGFGADHAGRRNPGPAFGRRNWRHPDAARIASAPNATDRFPQPALRKTQTDILVRPHQAGVASCNSPGYRLSRAVIGHPACLRRSYGTTRHPYIF